MPDQKKYIEIGDKTIEVDPTKVTIGEWYELTALIEADNKLAAGPLLMKMVMTVLGSQANKLSIAYLPLLIPRVIEIVAKTITPGSVETEVEDILKNFPSQSS